MRRPGTQLTHEVLVEEARFILRTLQRTDLFGDRVRLTEAERVLDPSISLSFADYCSFLNKYGYVRIDQLANMVEVTEGGALVAQDLDDAEFHSRLSRHFQKELQATALPGPTTGAQQPAARSLPRPEAQGPTLESTAASARSARPTLVPTQPERGSGAGLDDVLDRRYRRGEAIGSGTVGTVYRGQHVSLGRPMAIKEARNIFQFASYLRRDEIVRRLRTTVETHAALVHPNIIQIIDQNQEREHPYFVMELAQGGNLRQRLANEAEGRLELVHAIRILMQISHALRYAHAQGVLHLGLKPENVLFDKQGNVKLTDFGMARITDRAEDQGPSPVLVGGGTVGYMAPERLQPGRGGESFTAAADVYGLGMICYEMITGKLPGRRSPLPSQARKEVPSAFDDVFDRMTRDELGERCASVDEVLDGIYKAFPQKEVFVSGTILHWAEDPKPLPPRVEAPPPAPIEIAEPAPIRAADLSEITTGEVEVAADETGRRTIVAGAPPAPASTKRRPPPTPPPPRK